MLYVLLALAGAGCDSQNASPDDTEVLIRALSDTTLYVGDSPLLLDLAQFLTPDALTMPYSVHADGQAILLQRESNILSISPSAVGTSTLTISFPDNPSARESFDVEVRCATATGPGRISYLPHEAGQSWTYTYTQGQSTDSGYETRFTGTQTWTVQQVVDNCDSKSIELAIVTEGDYMNFAAPSLSMMDTTIYDLVTATISGRMVVIPRVTYEDVGIEWVQAPDAPGIVQKEEVWGFPSNRVRYDMEQDVGIVSYTYDSARIHQSYASISLQLVR
ncbi:MAG: hypothetical protein R2834_23645 [Rhodothermales bacterium]